MPNEKARHFLKAAETLWEAGLTDACASRCYYAMFWATISMLEWAGIRRDTWTHEGLRREFSHEMIVKRERCPAVLGEALRVAYVLRCEADYKRAMVSSRKTGRLLNRARQLVQMAEEIIQ